MEFFTDKFRELRKNRKLSMKDVAEMAGINWQTIWNWENQKIIPSEIKVRNLAKCLNIDVSYFSDLTPRAKQSDGKLNEIADSWVSFINPDLEHDLKYERLFIESIKKQTNKLQNATILLNTLLSYINAIFYVKDISLRYMIANSHFKDNLSLTKTYVTKGKLDSDFFPSLEAEKNSRQDQGVIDTGNEINNYEDFIPGSRKQRWGIISKIPILDSDGKIAGVIGLFIDITQRKKN
ncbi:MAG TPA: PAS domain-containing protein [Victivallales bacterium]|nr:PAS domain-containing protein [Victivallales bacterium]